MKFAISGPFQISGCFFGGHLLPSQDIDADLRIEVSTGNTVHSRSSFVFDEDSVEYARGFCRWLSYRSRCGPDPWRATKFTLKIHKDSETARRVAQSLLNGTTFCPSTPLQYPDELDPKPNQQESPSPLPDILQFAKLLKRWGTREYGRSDMEKSKDLQLSCLQALSECDEMLQMWDSNHDVRTAEWRRLAYDSCSNICQIHLVQEADGTVKDWIPFETMMHLSFNEDVTVKSRVRILRLCALSFREDHNQAFFFLLLARCLDPTDRRIDSMLRTRHPTPVAFLLTAQYLGAFREERSTSNRVLRTMKSVDVRDLKVDQTCTICYLAINPACGESEGQPREARVSSCNHYFHEICVRTLVSYQTQCPVCRREWNV